MDENLYEVVYKIINDNFELSRKFSEINVNDNLMDVGLDSISMVKIILGIEELYGIMIPDEDLFFDNFSSIEKIVQYIERFSK